MLFMPRIQPHTIVINEKLFLYTLSTFWVRFCHQLMLQGGGEFQDEFGLRKVLESDLGIKYAI